MPVDGALNVPGLTAEVRNTRSRQTIGDDHPRPGTSMLQATLVVVDQFCGSVEPSATPPPSGPRNRGQSPGPAAFVDCSVARAAARVAIQRWRMRIRALYAAPQPGCALTRALAHRA